MATLTNEELEAAAQAAERWPSDVLCESHWLSNYNGTSNVDCWRKFGWPAVAAVAVGNPDATTDVLPMWCRAKSSLEEIYRGYTSAIDRGRKHEVAAAFRAATKPEVGSGD